jgi:GNAT superfamily N-acetyltransferase
VQPQSFIIRPYEASDQPHIEWLYARTPPAGQVARTPAALSPELQRIPEAFLQFWVAVEATADGDAIIGMTGATPAADTAIDPPVAEFVDQRPGVVRLHHVTVAPERWRSGVGRALVTTALEWARACGMHAAVVETTAQQEAAIQLYLATGFREIGRSMFGRFELVWFQQPLSAQASSEDRQRGA